MQIRVRISWVKLGLFLVLTCLNGFYLQRLNSAEKKYNHLVEHAQFIENKLFLVQMQQQQINDTYVKSWANQQRTAEMMWEMGSDLKDKRRGILKKYPSVAQQISNGVPPKVQSNPWE